MTKTPSKTSLQPLQSTLLRQQSYSATRGLTQGYGSLNVYLRGWLKCAGIDFKTPTPVNGFEAKSMLNKANKASFSDTSHIYKYQTGRYLRVKMDNVCPIRCIMLNRNVELARIRLYLT